jgi:butyryl-CoA dehydrogenase
MDLQLTAEQKMLRDMARDFATREVEPHAAALDREHRFPAEIVKKMGELGLMGMMVPEAYGGAGLDAVSYVLAMEEINRACASTGVVMSVNNSLVCEPILEFGSEAQKQRWLPKLASGRSLGCFALTEPNNGSDAAAARTTAVADGKDRWRVNGAKQFITNAPQADVCVFFAQTDAAKGAKGITTFVVEKGTPGYSVGKPDDKLGITASHSAPIVFEDMVLADENRLGATGQGFKVAMSTLDGGRIGIAAQALGIHAACLEESVRYAKARTAFGQPIASFQAIQWMIADMATELEAARLLTLRAAVLKDRDARFTREASMAKLYASEAANRAATRCVQVHGGYGYIKDFPAERHFRDARITEIYEGTSEIQRLVIAASLLKQDEGVTRR